MEQLNLITNFLRIKDKNITITDEYDMGTHLELHGHLDYTAPKCPSCKGQMAKYDFQKASKIPYLETAGYPLLIRLRKRRFKCKECGKMAVAETPLVKKNHQISVAVNQKIAQLLIENQAMTHIAHRLSISTSSVIRKLNEFKFETDWNKLPEVIAMDMFSPYYKLARQLFPNAKIVLDRFHIVQHLSRAMNRVRIQIMNQFDRTSQEYRALKRYWKLIQQDSRKLSDKRFYRPMFRMHLTNKEILEKLLSYSDELRQHYELYQFLLFHFQEKNSDHFFSLIEQEIATVNPIFQTVFKTFLKDKDKVLNALELPYSNAKLEATNNLIKVIKRNAFGFRNFENFKKRILIALNIKKEKTKLVLSRC
ncbi:ISL3 family transposase [Streptococcus suis]|uniref:ISL3 family transposase n=2 Tax=Streptococcus suis TaxID=1307 RepID=UPI001ABEC373|nr:ISL3 family transposase [Streptococcus suis]MBO4112420.1 ISL3 family transposase [Streptococcus suis]